MKSLLRINPLFLLLAVGVVGWLTVRYYPLSVVVLSVVAGLIIFMKVRRRH